MPRCEQAPYPNKLVGISLGWLSSNGTGLLTQSGFRTALCGFNGSSRVLSRNLELSRSDAVHLLPTGEIFSTNLYSLEQASPTNLFFGQPPREIVGPGPQHSIELAGRPRERVELFVSNALAVASASKVFVGAQVKTGPADIPRHVPLIWELTLTDGQWRARLIAGGGRASPTVDPLAATDLNLSSYLHLVLSSMTLTKSGSLLLSNGSRQPGPQLLEITPTESGSYTGSVPAIAATGGQISQDSGGLIENLETLPDGGIVYSRGLKIWELSPNLQTIRLIAGGGAAPAYSGTPALEAHLVQTDSLIPAPGGGVFITQGYFRAGTPDAKSTGNHHTSFIAPTDAIEETLTNELTLAKERIRNGEFGLIDHQVQRLLLISDKLLKDAATDVIPVPDNTFLKRLPADLIRELTHFKRDARPRIAMESFRFRMAALTITQLVCENAPDDCLLF